jgi:hypothetical protein
VKDFHGLGASFQESMLQEMATTLVFPLTCSYPELYANFEHNRIHYV